jgi:hypothetical protein
MQDAEGNDLRDTVALEGRWGPWIVFPCHRWLSTEVDDCRISRTLFVGHQSPLLTYKVCACGSGRCVYVCVCVCVCAGVSFS